MTSIEGMVPSEWYIDLKAEAQALSEVVTVYETALDKIADDAAATQVGKVAEAALEDAQKIKDRVID